MAFLAFTYIACFAAGESLDCSGNEMLSLGV
jgi:hypothetical protein